MRKMLIALCALFILSAPGSAQAEDVDMAKVPCKDFLESGNDNIGMMLTWIDGYMSAKSDNTMMSEAWMQKLGTHMGTYCAKNPTHTIMKAIEAVPE